VRSLGRRRCQDVQAGSANSRIRSRCRMALSLEPCAMRSHITSKQVGDADHIRVFANQDAAETWFEENDPEGVAFEYEILE
jgi:hypothetical protein